MYSFRRQCRSLAHILHSWEPNPDFEVSSQPPHALQIINYIKFYYFHIPRFHHQVLGNMPARLSFLQPTSTWRFTIYNSLGYPAWDTFIRCSRHVILDILFLICTIEPIDYFLLGSYLFKPCAPFNLLQKSSFWRLSCLLVFHIFASK